MSTFIHEVAETLFKRYNSDMSRVVVMFPSLRARVFFIDVLSTITDRPIWQPSWVTIDELMERGSGLVRGERIRLISELHKIYVKYHPSEDFDKFYFWGDLLISDFDMIDKYLIDANQLLRNINDIKEIEADVSYMTPEQQLRILSFWRSIGSEMSLTEHKQRFLKVWRSLPSIYNEYRQRLFDLGIGYPGMIYRATAERIKRKESVDIGDKRFVIAGFNALSKSEEVLFDYIANSVNGAEFYWDYDNYYVENLSHEAGLFMRNNVRRYPEVVATTHSNFNDIDKDIRCTACVSNVVQVKHLADIISSLPEEELDRQTAIVLTDENMLIPLLHSLPEKVKGVNVTMGYPIKTTLAYSFLERLITLQSPGRKRDGEVTRYYHVDVIGLLTHPYIVEICKSDAEKAHSAIIAEKAILVEPSMFAEMPILNRIFCDNVNSYKELSNYLVDVTSVVLQSIEDFAQREYLRIISDEIRKVVNSIANCDIEVSVAIFISLLRRHIQTLTIPFEGEPVEGLQIMGILETRNLDFKNVIVLSMTDATFPGDRTEQPSFIPYGLRFAYDMPTHKEHEAMYAYYFYRLIQRAKRVDMLYCSRADYRSTGEKSRYIYQLEYESKYKILKRSVGVDLGVSEPQPIVVEKDEKILSVLEKFLTPNSGYRLSPTSLFRYVECPLKFYMSAIAHLKTSDELEDKIDALTFGNILHDAMQELYDKDTIRGVKNPHDKIEKLRNRSVVEAAVDKAIRKLLHYRDNSKEDDFSGDTLLVRDIITKYIIGGICRYDLTRDGFSIKALEDDVDMCYPISDGRTVNLFGRADRIDEISNGKIQVIDYKSGNHSHLVYNGVDALFNGSSLDRISNIFQTLLYAMMLHYKYSVDVVPSLYYASKMLSKDYSPLIHNAQLKEDVESYYDVKEEFESELRVILDELFDADVPFKQAEDENMCTYCDYKKICRR
jgi:hypothetical protein